MSVRRRLQIKGIYLHPAIDYPLQDAVLVANLNLGDNFLGSENSESKRIVNLGR